MFAKEWRVNLLHDPHVKKTEGGYVEMLEKEIERRMVKTVRERGGLCYKFVSPNNPGVPDRIIITPDGRVIFVELKTEVGRLANIQKWQLDEMRKRGADVRVAKGWEAVKALLEEVMPRGV